MRVLTETPVTIISAELSTLGKEENSARTLGLRACLDLQFGSKYVKQVRGKYNGVSEVSFVVNGDRDKLRNLAAEFGQESILALDTSRNATLLFIDQHHPEGSKLGMKYLGRFQAATVEEALEADGYTYDISQDTYYIIK